MSLSLLVSLAVGIASAATATAPAHDEAQMLYSTQLLFGAGGEPVITVGLMEDRPEAKVTSKGPMRIVLSGPAQASILVAAGTVLEASVEGGIAGSTRYRVVLEAFPGAAVDLIRQSRARWTTLGTATELLELGGIVSFNGRTIDSRRALVVEKPIYATKEAAAARAREFAEKTTLEKPPWPFADPVTRAKGTVVISDVESGIQLSQQDLVTIVPAGKEPLEVLGVEIDKGYERHRFEDRKYRGDIIVAIDKKGKLAVINRVSFEEMLQGVVPAEIFPNAPPAALDAQAISARGELLAQIGVRNIADPYLTCAWTECQVYGGLSKEQPTTNAAVQRTRGQMLFSGEDRIVDSVYHACSGGHTEHNENVWTGAPNAVLRGQLDAPADVKAPWPAGTVPTEEQLFAFVSTSPKRYYPGSTPKTSQVFRWTQPITRAQLDEMVNAKFQIGSVIELKVLARGVSGRAKSLSIVGQSGKAQVDGELTIRRLFGNLRSSMFIIEETPSTWRFVGGGYGHGVGMSQYGAMGMAEMGKSAVQILGHYYLGARVDKLY